MLKTTPMIRLIESKIRRLVLREGSCSISRASSRTSFWAGLREVRNAGAAPESRTGGESLPFFSTIGVLFVTMFCPHHRLRSACLPVDVRLRAYADLTLGGEVV